MGISWDKPLEKESVHFSKFKEGLPKLNSKVIAITGCTTGTGFIAAKTCAELGATVLMLNRRSDRAEKAFESVKAVAAPEAVIHNISCDLMDFESVKAAAKEVAALCPNGLDVLVNNAGIMAARDTATKDGYDTQMQTNHLSHFLLTRELLPLLEAASKRTGDARVVNHSSIARRNGGNMIDAKYLGKYGFVTPNALCHFFQDCNRIV
jgi:NAD(P)-dependent dehydrogenase (short-subunit alcohol dehydrogenase family)